MVLEVPNVSERSWGERLIPFFSVQKFESRYDILCADASIQALRAKIWSQLVSNLGIGRVLGPDVNDTFQIEEESDEDSVNSLLSRHDIRSTVTLVMKRISSLLLEIKATEHKYRPERVIPTQTCDHDIKCSRSSKAVQTLSLIRSSSLRQRSRTRKKHRLLIGLARWAICDKSKFEEKLRQVKGLIDGLEDILRAAGTVLPSESHHPSSESGSIFSIENPPPYSSILSIRPWRSSNTQQVTALDTRQSVVSRLSDNSIFDMLEHHAGMKQYLIGVQVDRGHVCSLNQDLISRLTTQKFKELRMDVFDELQRRQESDGTTPQRLPDIQTYPPRRNEARRKLSTIIPKKFNQLLFDIVWELERRFPHLKDPTLRPTSVISVSESLPATLSTVRYSQTRRWGHVEPRNRSHSPPPYLRYRPAHHATVRSSSSRRRPHPPAHVIGTSKRLSNQTTVVTLPTSREAIKIRKSFRVSVNDPTNKVLPAILRKYNIRGPSQQYSLHIVYNGHEQMLELEEKPMLIFKQLDREGKRPMFMLRLQQALPPGEEDASQCLTV